MSAHELGFVVDTAVLIEHYGDTITIRPMNDPEDGRRRVQELVVALSALGPVGEVEKRDADNFADRPDRMIAATAIVQDLTLVTINGADFRDIPNLRLEPHQTRSLNNPSRRGR